MASRQFSSVFTRRQLLACSVTKSTLARPFIAALSRPPVRSHPLQKPFKASSARPFSSSSSWLKDQHGSSQSTIYSYNDIALLSSSPSSNRIIIDVREPSELQSTGTIPSAQNVPIKSAPDALFMTEEDFEDKYGFARPGKDDEVIFFCKSGVRSKAAAQLAAQAGFGGRIGEYPGSWLDWEKNGGRTEKVK